MEAVPSSPLDAELSDSSATTAAGTRHRWLRLRNPQFAVPGAIGALVAVIATALVRGWPVGVFYDDALYLTLARSLATGEGYRFLNLPGHPAATHYPPGYPAFLALLWQLAPNFPDNSPLFKLANALLLGVVAFGAVSLYRDELNFRPALSAATALAFTVAVPLLVATGVLFSEPLFLAVLMPALAASSRAVRKADGDGDAIVAGVLCAAAALVRTVGMAAVLGTLVVLLWKRQPRRMLLFGAAAGMLLLPWQLWSSLHAHDVPATLTASYGPYAGWVMEAIHLRGPSFPLQVAWRNVGEIARPFRFFAAAWPLPAIGAFPIAATAIVVAAGLFATWRRAPAVAAFTVVYFGVVLTWPYLPDRFLWGVWPVVGAVLVSGVLAIVQWSPRAEATLPRQRIERAARGLVLLGIALATVSYVHYNIIGISRGWVTSPQGQIADASRPISRWVSERTLVTDVIATDGDPFVYLYTGRESVPIARFGADEYVAPASDSLTLASLRDRLASLPIRYVVITNRGDPVGRAALQLVNSHPAELRIVDTLSNGGLVFTPVTPTRTP